VLAFAVTFALIAGLLCGLAPALRLSRAEATSVLLSGARSVGGGIRANRTHAFLVGAQVALTLLLLNAGGAVAEGFLRLTRAPLGYDPRNILVIGIPLHDNTYMTWEQRAAYFDQLRHSVAALPGVLSAAISTRATPPASGLETGIAIASRSATKGTFAADEQQARLSMVSPEYFSLLRIPLLAGRIWDQTEAMRAAPVAVINETMARHYWGHASALGQSLRIPDLKSQPFRIVPASAAQSFQIVGVVADARNDGLGQAVRPAVYVPYTFDLEVYTEILVHTNGSLASVFRAVREQVRNIDADQQVEGHGEIVSLEEVVTRQDEWQQAHLATILLGGFGLLALALASVGLYSVVSYGVAQRTNEFGIRVALGAQRRHVLQLVFTSVGASVGCGILAGILLSFYASKLLVRWTEVGATNPIIVLNATSLFLAAAAIACLLPARQATSIDPMQALRRQ
jgi:predicted permease